MKSNDDKFQLMYEASPDAIMLLDKHGFLDCNPATLKIFGCATAKEFIGRHPSKYSPPTQPDGRDSRKEADEKIATAYKNGSNLFEWTHRRANGEVFPAEVQLTLLKLNGKKILQASVREISKRKRAEELLSNRDVQFSNLLNMVHIGVLVHRQGKILYANTYAAKKIGAANVDELIGQDIISFILPEELPEIIHRIEDMLTNGVSYHDMEERYVRVDGQIIYVNTSAKPIEYDGEQAILVVVQEITKRKQAEERLQSIVRLSTRAVGDDFFRVLVASVAKALNVKTVFVAKFDSTEPISADSLAIWIDGEPAENRQRSLSGTPCEEVAKGKSVFVAEGVQAAFPDDQWLSEVGLESYLGLPIIDNDGHVVGHIGVMDDKPLHNQQEIENILNIFTGRVAVELERKQTQETLATSEKNFRHLVEADCYALVVHKDFHLVYANALAQEIFEISDLHSILGQSILDYIRPRYQKLAKLAIQRVIRQNRTISPIQIKGVTANGRDIDLDLRSIPITFDESAAVMTIIYDITERKRAEALSSQTNKILEMIATGECSSNVYDAIALMYESRHPGMRCSLLELKGDILIHSGAPSLPKEYCDALNGLKNGSDIDSCGTSTYTGKRVLVEDIATDPIWSELKSVAMPYGMRCCWSEPIKNFTGKVLGAFGMYYNHPALPNEEELHDLESGARLAGIIMERELREATLNKLSQAIEQAGESIMITDRKGIIEYVNPAFTKLTGYSAEEAIGQTPRLLKSGNQDAAFYERLWGSITHGDVWQGKVIDRKKDGSFYPVILVIAPITGNAGVITHFVGTHTDVSELDDMEHRFHQAQKMEAIGTLVGGIAHDFNNMLAGMTGNLYLAKKKVQDNPDVLQKLANIEKLSFRAADMIDQLLTFARKGMVNMKPIPLNPFIKETLKFLRTSVTENIALHHDICKEPLLINGDATQLHQVLMNLVNNARDAIEEVDDPTIIVKLELFQPDDAFMASHSYFKPAPYAHLSVEDNGCGIPEHQIEHLFEPFFTTKEQGKGTGLGLAMVFGAIKTHHGYVEMNSIENKGSTFHIYLPLLEIEEIASPSLEDESIAEGSGETILLVDDEAVILETGKEVLESLGYQVLIATDGLQAVEVFTEHQDEISLIITDVVMPGLGGVKAVERIRKIQPDIKVIYATGYDKNISLPDAIDTSKTAVLSKPYNIEELSKTIRSQLEL